MLYFLNWYPIFIDSPSIHKLQKNILKILIFGQKYFWFSSFYTSLENSTTHITIEEDPEVQSSKGEQASDLEVKSVEETIVPLLLCSCCCLLSGIPNLTFFPTRSLGLGLYCHRIVIVLPEPVTITNDFLMSLCSNPLLLDNSSLSYGILFVSRKMWA